MVFSIFSSECSASEALIILFAIVLVYLIALTAHEWAHSFVAYKCGDLTPKLAGRLSFNPARHLDFWGFLCFLVAGIGWAKPVTINPTNFKKYRADIAKVSIAGVFANFILVIISSFFYCLCYKVIGDINNFMSFLIYFFELSMVVNAFLIVFNLIPIYPLDGFNFISSFLPSNSKFIDYNVRKGYKLLLTIIFVDIFLEMFTGVSLVGFILDYVCYWIYHPLELLWFKIF